MIEDELAYGQAFLRNLEAIAASFPPGEGWRAFANWAEARQASLFGPDPWVAGLARRRDAGEEFWTAWRAEWERLADGDPA